MRTDTVKTVIAGALIAAAFLAIGYMVAKRASDIDRSVATAEAVGKAIGSMPMWREGCPRAFQGRALTHQVYRESDKHDPYLVCFYAPAKKI